MPTSVVSVKRFILWEDSIPLNDVYVPRRDVVQADLLRVEQVVNSLDLNGFVRERSGAPREMQKVAFWKRSY